MANNLRASRRYLVIGVFGVVLAGTFVGNTLAIAFVGVGLFGLLMSFFSGLKGFSNGQ